MIEPIAIIGMSCRFPEAPDPDAFWDLLSSGKSPLREIPAARWDAEQFYDAAGSAGKMYVRHGYFLDDIDRFDAQFFRISPKEAVTLDPQHRLLLETGWEAFASAGIQTEQLLNSSTAVFVGLMNHDYWNLITRYSAQDEVSFTAGMGNSSHCAAGRLAYTFGLQGPCATIDTACSSSLVALHQACEALRHGSCELALAGAANLILDPFLMISMCSGKVLAHDGICKTFDASADGYGRGEGCGVLVLKRLADAQRDNNRILAVIRHSVVNQNGPGNGMTVPNGEAQRALLRRAISEAGLSVNDIDYLEAHGSATQLGDLIEMNSIAAVMGEGRDRNHPLIISSVKPYIGHLEPASGMAGLIKVILSLHHETIPRHLHLNKLNPHFDLDAIPALIPSQSLAWKKQARPRIAGVSAFGISGTNAHIIIEDTPQQPVKSFKVENPFQRKPYWSDILLKNQRHEGRKMRAATAFDRQTTEIHFAYQLRLAAHPFLADHQVQDQVMFPAAGFIEAALDAMHSVENKSGTGIRLDNLVIENPLLLELDKDQRLHAVIRASGKAGSFALEIAGASHRHVRCAAGFSAAQTAQQDINGIKTRCARTLDVTLAYRHMAELGINYGSRMRPVVRVWRGQHEALAQLSLPEQLDSGNYYLHPVLLDGALQALAFNVYIEQLAQGAPQFYLPLGMKSIVWHSSPGRTVYVHARYLKTDPKQEMLEADLSLLDENGRVLADISGVYLKRADRPALRDSTRELKAEHLYQETWQPLSALAMPGKDAADGSWLILSADAEDGALLRDQFIARGSKAILLSAAASASALETPTGIVVLSTQAAGADNTLHASMKLLTLLQAMSGRQRMPDLYLVTRGARSVNPSDAVDPGQAALWGLLQCARHELGRARMRSIDLDTADSFAAQTALLIQEIMSGDSEQQVAIRQAMRNGLRLNKLPETAYSLPRLNGTYLITGGLGGMGLVIAEWLAANGVSDIVLLSRRAPDEQTRSRLSAMRARVTVQQADVGDAEQVARVLQMLRQPQNGFAPLKGIIHAAGVLSDGMLANQNGEKYAAVLHAKIAGAWNLHHLSSEDSLDHFILFSSIASVTGAPAQSNYGAANAFLDALAWHRRAHGLPATSINWGPWAEVGMAKDWAELHAARGVRALSPETGAASFAAALSAGLAQIVIADIDWTRFPASLPAGMQHQFSALISNVDKQQGCLPVANDLAGMIRAALKSALGYSVNDNPGDEDNFFDLGMDSLLAMQFNEELKNLSGGKIELPMVTIFQYPSLSSLVSHIEMQGSA